MSRRVLKRMRCGADAEHGAGDDIHFLDFHRKVHQGRVPAAGDPLAHAATVLDPLNADPGLAARVEEDWDAGFCGQTLTRLRGWMVPFFNSLGDVVSGLDGTVAEGVRSEFRRGIPALRGNDLRFVVE